MRIVDTHLHLVYLDRFRYPWLDGAPALAGSFTLPTYLGEARSLGIEAMLHMEVDVAEEDIAGETAFATGLGDGIAGAIAACRPESPDFPAWLETAAANPRVRGFRRILHTVPDDVSEPPLFAENLRRLSPHGLTFDLCVLARQLVPVAARLARACPDVQFVLDHCGVPDVAARALDPWRADLKAVAALPNVACKVSGIVAYATPTWTVEDLRPFVEHAIDCFGWDRVVWGSDWPVCTPNASLSRWVAATHAIIAGASAAEKAKLLSENAERIYRLG
jgi:predicted TIM-barrel fold metal-dependent hydrolase